MKRKIIFMLLLLSAAALIGVPEASALPQYVAPGQALYGSGFNCGTCHVDPGGGGDLTAYGSMFAAQPNHFTEPGITAALTAIGSPSAAPTATSTTTPTATPTLTSTPTETPTLTPTPTPIPTPIPTVNGSISGMKFNDLNNDSVKDANESGLANWTINLTDQNGSTVTATTDVNGNYTFSNLTPGNYTVAEILETGWMQTFPTNGTYSVTITGNESINGIDFGNNLPAPQLPTNVTAVRTIEKESLPLGESTNVTVNISSTTSQALSLQEIIPAGWSLTRISDDADAFKNNTNEWIWFNMTLGVNRIIVYRLTAPSNATIGTYQINGTVSNSSGVIAVVQGNNTITLDIIASYRKLGSDSNSVETTDVLTAVDDWTSGMITTQTLLDLIDEWLMG